MHVFLMKGGKIIPVTPFSSGTLSNYMSNSSDLKIYMIYNVGFQFQNQDSVVGFKTTKCFC